jgi:NADPH:quinone reductase-like Zn-dependent oxidoreductase
MILYSSSPTQRFLQPGDFKPRIDPVFPFAQIVEAYRYMESNEQIGKIVVTV